MTSPREETDLQGAEVLLPEPTLARVLPLIREFRQRKLSGSVTITLHFLHGEAMPSDVGMHERQVGRRRQERSE